MGKSTIFDYDDPMKVRSPAMRSFMEEVHDSITTHAATSTTTTTTTSSTTSTTSSTTTTTSPP